MAEVEAVENKNIKGNPKVKDMAFHHEDKWWTLDAINSEKNRPALDTLRTGHFAERGSNGKWSVVVWTEEQVKKHWTSKSGTIPPKK